MKNILFSLFLTAAALIASGAEKPVPIPGAQGWNLRCTDKKEIRIQGNTLCFDVTGKKSVMAAAKVNVIGRGMEKTSDALYLPKNDKPSIYTPMNFCESCAPCKKALLPALRRCTRRKYRIVPRLFWSLNTLSVRR